jgi:ribonuclease BN (tRNA processing enzyme)
LLHDAQYFDHEYGAHVGWGHSALADAMQFADRARVRNLVLFHHDPYHTDAELEEVLVEARKIWPAAEDRVRLANEGMTITFGARGVELATR